MSTDRSNSFTVTPFDLKAGLYNRPYSCSQYRTGASLRPRLMWGVSSSANSMNLHESLFNDISPYEPALQASVSPILRVQIIIFS